MPTLTCNSWDFKCAFSGCLRTWGLIVFSDATTMPCNFNHSLLFCSVYSHLFISSPLNCWRDYDFLWHFLGNQWLQTIIMKSRWLNDRSGGLKQPISRHQSGDAWELEGYSCYLNYPKHCLEISIYLNTFNHSLLCCSGYSHTYLFHHRLTVEGLLASSDTFLPIYGCGAAHNYDMESLAEWRVRRLNTTIFWAL